MISVQSLAAFLFFSVYLRRHPKSFALGELIQKCGALVTFLNDRAYQSAHLCVQSIEYSSLEYILGFLEVSEIIIELSSLMVGGPLTKWVVIVFVQVAK